MQGTVKDWKDGITIAEANAEAARITAVKASTPHGRAQCSERAHAWGMVAAHIREALEQEAKV